MKGKEVTVDKQLTNSNFGKWGWSMIIAAFLFYYFWAGIGTDGLNLYPSAFADVNGWDSNTLLAYATPAGIIGVIGGLVFGLAIIKLKPRKTAGVCVTATGILYFFFGMSAYPVVYFILLALSTFFCQGFGLIATSTLMANWFPRKKGIALGWATIGAAACTATYVAALSALLNSLGLKGAFMSMGGIITVLGIAVFFWVKDYPEEVGEYPDNIECDPEQLRASMAEHGSYKSPFTISKLLRDKDMWLISLGSGLLWLVLVGILSQFIPSMTSVGYTQTEALAYLTLIAVLACPGSYFWGWLNQKIGAKYASVIFALDFIAALILFILQSNTIIIFVACLFLGFGLCGLLNFMPSLIILVYGRYDFMAANRLITPIASVVRVFAFLIMAALLAVSGGDFALPYTVFIGLEIIGMILILFVTNTCKGKTDPR